MLYAQMNKDRWDDIPAEWDEVRAMFQYLNHMTYGYQLNLEKKMFATQYGPEYRCTLIKWESGVSAAVMQDKKREVLLETSDPAQLEAALFMLISEAEVLARAHKQKVSWVP